MTWSILILTILCLLTKLPGPWETLLIITSLTMMAIQEIEDQLHQSFQNLGKIQQNSK